MVQNAYDSATQFDDENKVRNKIVQLKSKYKGITNWDVDIVEPKVDTWRYTRTQSENPINQVFKPVKKGDEYVVRWTINGKTDENKTYYTDDKDDANATYLMMVKNAEELNKKV